MGDHTCTIDIEFDGDSDFDIEFGVITEIITDASGIPVYIGDYDVIPKVYEDQVLATKNHRMTRDVTVRKVPQYEVSNNEGGVTLIIGDEYYG